MAPVVPISIYRGETFEFGIMYAEDEFMSPYPVITGMPATAPVRLYVADHGIPDGWPVRIACMKSPSELNTPDDAWVYPKVIDADTLELNDVNAHCWRPFSGTGLLIVPKPADITGWRCRAQVRKRADGELLWSWDSDPLQNPDSLVIVDTALSQFVLTMSATQTELLDWNKGVYDAEVIAPGGQVYKLVSESQIEVIREVTR